MSIFKNEGLLGLYAGVTPAVARHIPYTGFGAMGQAIAVPCDLIKVRMQNDGRLVASGKLEAPRYTGLADAFTKIKAQEGVGGFYAGCTPAIQRAALVNLGELTTYDTAKKSVVVYTGDNLLCHLCSAICSGFVASLCSTPADVAKSCIMSQTALADGTMPYSGTLDCWKKVVANEGPAALYKGFLPGWLRLGPWQLVFWCSYEQLRIVTGIGGFKSGAPHYQPAGTEGGGGGGGGGGGMGCELQACWARVPIIVCRGHRESEHGYLSVMSDASHLKYCSRFVGRGSCCRVSVCFLSQFSFLVFK